jgi:hypothetical protein
MLAHQPVSDPVSEPAQPPMRLTATVGDNRHNLDDDEEDEEED